MLRTLRSLLWVTALLAVLATGGAYLYRWYVLQRADEWALELDGRPAPPFTLTDQRGQKISLDHLSGQVTLVTFVYTSCPDTCPLTLRKLIAARQLVPASAQGRVRIVAITVDPDRDTVERIAQYLRANGFTELTFLTGARSELEPVWSAFAVAVQHQPRQNGEYEILHTAVTYVLDREGRLAFLVRDEALEPGRLASLLERLAAS